MDTNAMTRRLFYIFLLLIWLMPAYAQTATKAEKADKELSQALKYLYRAGDRVDRYLLQGVDTDYITLPEHCWRLALTTGMVGINSNLTFDNMSEVGRISFLTRTSSSIDVGFHAGYRSLGFGYSWDAMHAYSQKLSFSLGSKIFGLDFSHQKSANIQGKAVFRDLKDSPAVDIEQGLLRITNTNLSLWYALNSAHYSHRAAISQSYIQRRTAGSLLLSLSYMATDVSVHDTLTYKGQPIISKLLMNDITHLRTHQVAVGLGYGINYTPNRGKVLLHLDAHLKLVCYSINEITFAVPDSIVLPGEPHYDIDPRFPVHVTGNLRAAVSWEICPWAHLSWWVIGNNIRFTSKNDELSRSLEMSNWNWQTCLSVGVRLGAGKERVRKALDDETLPMAESIPQPVDSTRKKLPQWVTDYFYSPRVRY